MKDPQTPLKVPAGGIPIVSTLLHVMSMPLLVLFRHGFGYLYLSPKKIFLSLAFAQSLFAFAVLHDPAFGSLVPLAVSGLALSALYLVHLTIALWQQQRESAEHDQFAGKSWLLAFLPEGRREKFESVVHGVLEPMTGVIAGLLLLSSWLGPLLVASGASLALKELIRGWLVLRTRKVSADGLVDVEEKIKISRPGEERPLAPKGRTAPERHVRVYEDAAKDEGSRTEERATVLRLMPPYDREQAEVNFRKLSQDLNPEIPSDADRLRQLHAAVTHFREL